MAKVLVFAGDEFEDMELMYPKYRLEEAGFGVVVAGLKGGHKYVGKNGYPVMSDAGIWEVKAAEFAGVVCPGGWMPDKLRRDDKVKQLVREFHEERKLIGAICHGGWIVISAGVYRGVKVTGSMGIRDDLVNAGAVFEDSAVVVNGHFVSSRKPEDLPAFMKGCLQVLEDKG